MASSPRHQWPIITGNIRPINPIEGQDHISYFIHQAVILCFSINTLAEVWSVSKKPGKRKRKERNCFLHQRNGLAETTEISRMWLPAITNEFLGFFLKHFFPVILIINFRSNRVSMQSDRHSTGDAFISFVFRVNPLVITDIIFCLSFSEQWSDSRVWSC